MRKTIIIILILAILMIVVLHVCPSFENWLHHITGWY